MGLDRLGDLLGKGTSSILSAKMDQVAFDRILNDPAFAEIEAYPDTGAFGRTYFPATFGDHDRSFAVGANGIVALICLCAPLDGKLGFYGRPLRLVGRRGLDGDTRRAAVQAAFLRLDELAKAHGLREVSVLDEQTEADPMIEETCRIRGAAINPNPVACVDLTAGPAAWRAALRKSSRSLINWGRRNMSIVYVNKETPDRSMFDRYRAFHAEVAGRITRPEESWNVTYEWIAQGKGELVLAFVEGNLLAGSMFIDGKEISVYSSGVYDRTQFDKPLAHYLVWLGIERAYARGMKTLELGAVPPRGTVTDKEYKIGYFKRGFATHIEMQHVWRWPVTLKTVPTENDVVEP